MTTDATAIDTVKEAWKALEAQDRVRLRDLLAPGIMYMDSAVYLHKPKFTGRDETLDFLLAMQEAYPDVHLAVTDIFAVGEKVVLQGFATGTHTRESEFHGVTVPATDLPITLPLCQVCTVRDGKITEAASYYDAGGLNRLLDHVSPTVAPA